MKLYKKFIFWLPLIYVVILIINGLGGDDMNLLWFFASPVGWVAETHWFVINFTHPANAIPFIIVGSLVTWFVVGFCLDKIIKKVFHPTE